MLDDGNGIAARLFVPDGEPRGLVSYVHGLQSHSGWFLATGLELAASGFFALFADRRGSGRNPREQDGRSNPGVMVADVVEIVGHLRRLGVERGFKKDLPVGLIGHSFGGLLASVAACVAGVDVDWLYLISPRLVQQKKMKWVGFFERLSMGYKMLFAPQRMVKIPIPDWALTDSEEGREFVKKDPLRLRKMEAGMLRASMALDKQLEERAGKTDCPALLVLAAEDKLVDNELSAQLFERLFTGPRDIKTYENCGHTLELTPARERLVPELLDFLSKQSIH